MDLEVGQNGGFPFTSEVVQRIYIPILGRCKASMSAVEWIIEREENHRGDYGRRERADAELRRWRRPPSSSRKFSGGLGREERNVGCVRTRAGEGRSRWRLGGKEKKRRERGGESIS